MSMNDARHVAALRESTSRWDHNRDRERSRPRTWSSDHRYGFYLGEDLRGLTFEAKAIRKIELTREALKRDRYNVFLKKRLARMERTHGQRCLLGYDWLLNNPEHPLSPMFNDRHLPPF